jgi:hypothetical protein
MYTKRLLVLAICSLFVFTCRAQENESTSAVDLHSLSLYNAAQWKTLLTYGKEKLSTGIDFPLLRMRTGYAAFMTGNYSQSLLQYKKVLDAEPENGIALYYVYLNNLYLNNITAARYYAAKLPAETKTSEKIAKIKLSAIEGEFSYKMPTDTFRKNAQYYRAGFNIQLGYRLELQQSVAFFNQLINEPRLSPVISNRQRVDIREKQYYGKLIFAASGKLSVLGGFHYIYTPFNNLAYNNTIVFAGIKYTTPFVHVKAMANFGNITDTTYNQYDATVSIFPLGNTKLYSITRAAYGNDFTLSQILGYGVTRKIWLEANVTIGKFNNLLENDALYVFNDIDQKQFKAGGSLYASVTKKLLLTFNYTFEQKLKYHTPNTIFYQHSINGGLSWKF